MSILFFIKRSKYFKRSFGSTLCDNHREREKKSTWGLSFFFVYVFLETTHAQHPLQLSIFLNMRKGEQREEEREREREEKN